MKKKHSTTHGREGREPTKNGHCMRSNTEPTLFLSVSVRLSGSALVQFRISVYGYIHSLDTFNPFATCTINLISICAVM